MALIPEKGGAEDIKDFRSISLVQGLHKLWQKIEKGDWKGGTRFPECICWGWGVGKILDAVLVANDAIDLRTRSSKVGLVCKLDTEKLKISSLGYGKNGFWVKVVVMDTFLYTVRLVPLVNGSYRFFFRALKVCSWMTLFPLVGTNSGGINRSGIKL